MKCHCRNHNILFREGGNPAFSATTQVLLFTFNHICWLLFYICEILCQKVTCKFTSFMKSLQCTVNFLFRLFLFVWLWESVFAEICCLWPFLICQFWKDCIIVKFCGELDFFFFFFSSISVQLYVCLTCFVEDWWPVWCHVDMRKCLAVLHLSTWVPAAVYSQQQ